MKGICMCASYFLSAAVFTTTTKYKGRDTLANPANEGLIWLMTSTYYA